MFYLTELRILSFPCNQFYDRMQEGDGDEMLCHLKIRNASLGGIMAKVCLFNIINCFLENALNT